MLVACFLALVAMRKATNPAISASTGILHAGKRGMMTEENLKSLYIIFPTSIAESLFFAYGHESSVPHGGSGRGATSAFPYSKRINTSEENL